MCRGKGREGREEKKGERMDRKEGGRKIKGGEGEGRGRKGGRRGEPPYQSYFASSATDQ